MGGAAWAKKNSSLRYGSVIISRKIFGVTKSMEHTGLEVDLGWLFEAVITSLF